MPARVRMPVSTLGRVPGWQDGGRSEREAGRQLAAELLEAVLKLQEAGDSTPHQIFPYLIVRTSYLRLYDFLRSNEVYKE